MAQYQVPGNVPSQQTIISSKKEKMLVVAIDFGTTYSGYCFSTKSDYHNDPNKISVNQNWVAGSRSLVSLKAPTCILFKEDQTFHSFGYEAENAFSELALDDQHVNYYFFRRFKMILHDKKVSRDLEVKDEMGHQLKAMFVFSEVIRFLKDHLMKTLSVRGNIFMLSDIHFVLTVPAIWSDSAKQFMRESAYMAGIEGGNLSIALEPEAASLYCQMIPTDKVQSSGGTGFAVASSGSKYMVIDLGGGTADITVHERQEDGGLKELHKASGGAWGGTKVDEEFNQLLIKLVGARVFKTFSDKHMADQIDLQRELETKKRTITPQSKGKITMTVPVSLAMTYQEVEKETIKEAVEQSIYKGKIQWLNDKLRIEAEVFQGLFKPCCTKIVEHIHELLKKPEVKGTNIFLMVGGFSESAMVQDAVMKGLPNGKVIIPEESGLGVLKGATIFGHRPVAITSRVARYTYGINISPPFNPNIHPQDRKVAVGDKERCRDVFKKYIQMGDSVRVGEARSGKHITIKQNQREMLLKIFASPKPDPKYVDEEGTEFLGKVIVNLPESDDPIRVEVKMMFGETELTVEAMELTNQTKYTAYFDFL